MAKEKRRYQLIFVGDHYEIADSSNSEIPKWPVQDEGGHWHSRQFSGQRARFDRSHVDFGFQAIRINEKDIPIDADGELDLDGVFIVGDALYTEPRAKNPAPIAWEKNGIIYTYGKTNLVVYPPTPLHKKYPDKWILNHGKTFVGAFDSLAKAKKFGKDNFYLDRSKNPTRRTVAAKPKARSRATGKAPSARLIARRKKDTVKGYYPNPVADKIALHFNAGNDSNGNPRRVFVVVNTNGNVEGAFNEGYIGSSAVTKHFPGIAIVGRFDITPAQYREIRKHYEK